MSATIQTTRDLLEFQSPTAAVIADREIIGFAISCRALGMGIEHSFLRHVLNEMQDAPAPLRGRIIPTPRNIPARYLYRDNGFTEAACGVWEFAKSTTGN